MENTPELMISQDDFLTISNLLQSARGATADLLEEELSRAHKVPDSELPSVFVSMNSEVSFKDLETGQLQTVRLVYPHEADIEKSWVSILAPIGAALIGLREGQQIEWPISSHKKRRIQVLSVKKAGI